MEQFQFSQKTNNGFLKKFWLFVFLTFFSLGVKAQCPTGDINLNSQAQVDAFGVNYPNCTEISGGLFIYGNITDLSPLSNLTSIGGHLQISDTYTLTNLDGLSNLTSIGGYLAIYNNQALTDISGLQNINPASIISSNYGLYITFNTSLSVCNLPNFCTYLA